MFLFSAWICRTGEKRYCWAWYAPTEQKSGQLIYRRGESLFAIAFDPSRLQASGAPVPLLGLEAVKRWQGVALIDLSESGVLAYVPGTAEPEAQSALLWVD